MDHLLFARNLVKGKIAETVFAQMLRESGEFTVLEFGYQKVIPELVQHGYDQHDSVVEMLRAAPDFAVINNETKKVHLVEVKFQHVLNKSFVLKDAQRMAQAWNPSYLFVATLENFYFDDIEDIIKHGGEIAPMHDHQIKDEMQAKYLKILQDFEAA